MEVLDQLRQPRFWAPALVLMVGVALTALTATELLRSERDQQDMQVSNVADGFGALLQMHLSGCEEALRAASMVASAAPDLDIRRWQSVGRQVRVGEFNACAESMIYLDATAAAMSGKATRRTLIAPAEADQKSLRQFDPWADPVHRAAMEVARDKGQPVLTTRATWPGIGKHIEVAAWYMPVYQRDALLDTPEVRAAALIGYVGIPVRVQGVVEVLVQQFPNAQLTLEFHSVASDMFDVPASASPATSAGLSDASAAKTRERTLRVGGRWWTLRAGVADPPADLLGVLHPSAISLVAGLSLSVLMAWLTWMMLTQSARAHALARLYSRDAHDREARLRSVLDGTRDGIFTLDVQGTILSANQAVREILGYGEADLLGQSTSLLLPPERGPEYRARWIEFVRAARRNEHAHSPVHELDLRHRDGHVLCARGSLSLVRTDTGEFVVWVISDLSHEREMERQAREAAALNQAIMDVAPIGVMTIRADGAIATANPASHAMLGYGPGELVGQPAAILSDAQDEAGFSRSPMSASGPFMETESVYVRKNGSRFPAGVIALPLRDATGRLLGGLRMVMDITERKRAAARIEHMALHDSLTGLPNRLLLSDRAGQALARAERSSGSFAVVLIDLDRFKQINDTLGHNVGDEVLKAVAQRLMSAVRATDTVVRMGGDEFALLLPDISNPEQAIEVAQKILKTMGDDLVFENHRLHVTASLGVAFYPAHGTDLPTLLRNADAAMYDAKARGRDAVSLFDEKMSSHANHQLELQADLRQAVAGGEFVLHYQPLVDTPTGEVRALEALLRWKHPRRGLVSPLEFIPLAEDTGLIVQIGAWALRQACADLAQLRRQGRPDLRMAVNLSPRQFTADGLDASVAAALSAASLEGSALELEITESVLMSSLERTQGILATLRAMEVRIAIDDFGTGYSSLSYLAHFPVQTVKVDRSFVRQIDSGDGTALLAGAIVAMAHRLGLEVVAEGVETPDQHAHLIELGCELLQGFRFSKPVPIEQLPEAMARVEAMPRLPSAPRLEVWTGSAPLSQR
jgi:diguanylate cyclase (GGDEF)-like protein/PAS domain S-box-containing protein